MGRSRGFSLIELIIVLVIMGVVTAIAVPRLAGFERKASLRASLASFRNLERAMSMYYDERGAWPPDATPGIYEGWMTGYIDKHTWGAKPDLGVAWDWNSAAVSPAGVGANVAIAGGTAPDMVAWTRFEKQVDDGDANAGRVRIAKVGSDWALIWRMEPDVAHKAIEIDVDAEK